MPTAKRKPTRKTTKPTRARTARKPKPPTESRANYAAQERPRRCPAPGCRSPRSAVLRTIPLDGPSRVKRYRRCDACGQHWSSIEQLDVAHFWE